MLEFNISFPLQFINLLLLIYLLHKLLFKPVLGIMEKRDAAIRGQLQQAEGLQRMSEEMFAQYRDQIILARRESSEAIAAAQKEAAEGQRGRIELAREGSYRLVDDTKREIQAAIEKGKDKLREQAKLLSLNIAEKLLGRAI